MTDASVGPAGRIEKIGKIGWLAERIESIRHPSLANDRIQELEKH